MKTHIILLLILGFAMAWSKPSADTLWVDVRTPGEFEAGHLDSALNIPLQVLDQEFRKQIPNQNTVIALYCRSGNRSGIALRQVLAWGYKNAFNAGGYAALKAQRQALR